MSAAARAVTALRRRSALSRALGPAIAEALDAPDVVEALVNADGQVWFDRIGQGLVSAPYTISAAERETVIRLLAHEAGEIVGMNVVAEEITERKRAEAALAANAKALRESELRFRELAENMSQFAWTADASGSS